MRPGAPPKSCGYVFTGPGRCLRWSPTPPGPRWPPAIYIYICKRKYNRSFTSLQMLHTHTQVAIKRIWITDMIKQVYIFLVSLIVLGDLGYVYIYIYLTILTNHNITYCYIYIHLYITPKWWPNLCPLLPLACGGICADGKPPPHSAQGSITLFNK